MMVRERIRRVLENRCANAIVTDVRIGLGYTGVRLDDDRTGVAYTFRNSGYGGCTVFRGVRPLTGRSAEELLRYLGSNDPTESSVGLATANALANVTPAKARPGDVLEAVEILPTDRVGMVGFFGPLIPPLKSRVRLLEVFEESDPPGGDILPSSEAVKRLPQCDVALITSTTIVNNTIDPLLEAARKCREAVLLGSSTPMVPEALEHTRVTFLSGITVKDPAGILQVISEGGGTRFFKPFVVKWNLPLRGSS